MKKERSNGRWNVRPLVTVALFVMLVSLQGAAQALGSKEGSAEEIAARAKVAGRQAESSRLAADEKPTELMVNNGIYYTPKYAWSKQTQVYHYYECAWVKKIRPENLQTGDTPPEGRRLHRGCPSKDTN
jgi:hypothetical protein